MRDGTRELINRARSTIVSADKHTQRPWSKRPGTGPHRSGSYLSTNLPGLTQWSYSADGEGRLNAITAASGQNPLTGTSYDAFGATRVTFGSTDSDAFSYDLNTGRQTQYAFSIGNTATGTLTWNANGSLQKLAVVDPFYTPNNQTCTNTYDDLARLASNNCGASWSQSFNYDAFGNLSKTDTISFLPTYNIYNQYATLPAGVPSFSATGAINNDGFHSYYWDSELTNVQLDSNVFVTYDAFGRWVEQNKNAVITQAAYAPDGSQTLWMTGHNMSAYVRLPKGALAKYNSSGLSSYWHPDWLGSSLTNLGLTVPETDLRHSIPARLRSVGLLWVCP